MHLCIHEANEMTINCKYHTSNHRNGRKLFYQNINILVKCYGKLYICQCTIILFMSVNNESYDQTLCINMEPTHVLTIIKQFNFFLYF